MSKQPTSEAFDPARAAAVDPPDLLPGLAPAANLPVAAAAAGPPACIDPDDDPNSLTPYIDANGFDPADYKWVPVRRRPRADGFSEAKQRAFIEMLADTGSVEQAAIHVGMTVQSCYRLRRSPGAEHFAAAWNAAVQQAALRLVDAAFERAIHGSEEPVFDREGRRVGRRRKPSDRMLMFLLRAHLPDQYRHAHQSIRHPGEVRPAPLPRVAEAIATLEPAPPAEPHRLMPPDDLDGEIAVADMLDGTLPRWYREDVEEEPEESPLGEDFERRLAEARGELFDEDEDPFDK